MGACSNACGHASYCIRVMEWFDDSWSKWLFRCVFEDGGSGRVVVYAACEYDAWVTFSVLTGIRVSLEGLEHW